MSNQRDADGTVYTDTLSLDAPADAYRVTVRLFAEPGAPAPSLHGVSVATSLPGAAPIDLAPLTEAWGQAVDVPERSQMIDPDGGELWCSPTSTSMVLAYWADARRDRPEHRRRDLRLGLRRQRQLDDRRADLVDRWSRVVRGFTDRLLPTAGAGGAW